MSEAHPPELAEAFAAVARALLDAIGPRVGVTGPRDVLETMSRLAVEAIDGAEYCGFSLVEGGKVVAVAGGSAIPRLVDQIQYDTGEGPCLDAISEHAIITTPDLAAEDRWPKFVRRVTEETDIRSVLSFRLYAADNTMGALNLYSSRSDSFDDHDHEVGAIFAAHAAVAMAHHRDVNNLQTALRSRDVIATAKGLLMARNKLSDDEAFAILVRASQRSNTKLREIAERVVEGQPATPAEQLPASASPSGSPEQQQG